jgi:hypothetical protein
MRLLTMAAFVAAQIGIAAQPALAADLGDSSGATASREGAFAGARLRIPLDGNGAGKARAGLTIAPLVQSRRSDGSVRTRFGEGMELRLSGAAEPELAIGGRSLAQLTQGRAGPDGRKLGLSTIGWVAIGVGVAAVTVLALGKLCADGEICGTDDN